MHKGWNGIQRSFLSGIEMFTALSHDFVLHRNCHIAHNSQTPSPFIVASYGTHHIQLANDNATMWNRLLILEKGKGRATGSTLEELPQLATVASGETFGLVASEHNLSFKGLLEIKEDISEDEKQLMEECPSDEFDPTKMFESMNINLKLVNVSLTLTGSQSWLIFLDTNQPPIPDGSSDIALMSAIVDLTMDEAPTARRKHKSIHPEGSTNE